MNYRGGFTIIESMIVLAVSSVIFFSAMIVFRGSGQKIDFNQSMNDLQAKLKSYSNQVNTGVFAGNKYQCTVNTFAGQPARPILNTSSAATENASEDCIYLGKAIQPIPGTGDIYVYDVLGFRNVHSGISDTGVGVTTVAQAMPEPAGSMSGAGTFTFMNVEKYAVGAGSKIVSAKTNGVTSGMLKMYGDIAGGTSATARRVVAYSSNYSYTMGDENSSGARNCIEETTTCTTAYKLETYGWDLCIQGSDSTRMSLMSVKPTGGGIAVRISYTSCS